MSSGKLTFEKFVSGNGLLNLTLSIGVVFLMHTYTKILWLINPDKTPIDLGLNLGESLFFGFVTFLVIRRANNWGVKILFAVFEFIAVFLYYNSSWFGESASWYLTSYIATLSASSIFALGYISLASYKQKLVESEAEETKVNAEILGLTKRLQESNDELLELKDELEESYLVIEHSNKEVTTLQNKVTSLQDEVTSVKTSLLSEIETITTAKQRIERDLNALRTSAEEWERGYIKYELSRLRKSKDSNSEIKKLENRLNEIEL